MVLIQHEKEIENKLKLSFEEVHKRLGALKQIKLIKVIGFKNRAHIYQVTTKGKNLLKTWKK
jgi:DNA-binding Lrp family transcriptional regulator